METLCDQYVRGTSWSTRARYCWGTGDLAKVFSREVGPTGHVVLSDINESMLNVGRDRPIDAGCTKC